MKLALWIIKTSLLIAGTSLLNPGFANAMDMMPPKIQMVDEFGVNLFNGQVTTHVDTVSIGGAMGLSHSISTYANSFSTNYRGYYDKYSGRGRPVVIKQPMEGLLDVMRVSDFTGTADFIVLVSGVRQTVYTTATNFTYQALGDTRHILERRADGVYWTKPDGMVSKFEGGLTGRAQDVGALREVQYPNGFTIKTSYAGAISNTGFELKYIYQFDEADRYLDKPDNTSIIIPKINPVSWAQENPKYVQAVNLAREDCSGTDRVCSGNWPKAEFDWPAGMPRAMFLGTSIFKVIDATGGVTDFHFRSFDLAYDDYGNLMSDQIPGQKFSSRLTGIKTPFSTSLFYQYRYKTKVIMLGTDSTYIQHIYTEGVTEEAQMGQRKKTLMK